MPRLRTIARLTAVVIATVLALAVGGGSAGSTALPDRVATDHSVPGPKQPIDTIGISGAQFHVRSGDPHCHTGAGSLGSGFPVPRGAMVIGATVYHIDGSTTSSVYGELSRHNFTTGGSHILAKGTSPVATSGSGRLELNVASGYVMTEGEAINMVVSFASGSCLKGVEVHYIAHPEPSTSQLRVADAAPAAGFAPDGAASSPTG